MDKRSEMVLAKLHPILQDRLPKLIAAVASRGHTIGIVQGLRTFPEQDALYSQGRTRKGPTVTNAKGGQSYHNYGLAADFCLLNAKNAFPDPHPVWEVIAEEAEKLQLAAGFRWQHQDKPHVEVPGLNWRECLDIYRKFGEGVHGLESVAAEATLRFNKLIGKEQVDGLKTGN